MLSLTLVLTGSHSGLLAHLRRSHRSRARPAHTHLARTRRTLFTCASVVAALATAACGKDSATAIAPTATDTTTTTSTKSANISPEVIYDWNARAMYFAYLMGDTEPVAQTYEATMYAMVNAAMHDAVNAIVPRYRSAAYTFGYVSRSVDDFSPEATVATAAFTILEAIGLQLATDRDAANPYPLEWVRRQYNGEMNHILSSASKQAGISLGKDVAIVMLGMHPFGWTTPAGLAPYVSSGVPGDYRPTEPYLSSAPGFAGVAAWSKWPSAGRFVLTTPNQFRASPPYGAASRAEAVRTAAYATDFNEVRRLGGSSSERTAEQTSIAFFWFESTPEIWLRVARVMATTHQLDAWDTARLFALVAMAESDANVVAYDTKYAYPFWRPVSAIRAAEGDNNPDTPSDATWDVATAPFQLPTPPSPEFSSVNAVMGSAATTIIQALVTGETPFTLKSAIIPELERSFASVADAEQENADAQVFLGYNFRHSVQVGMQQGRSLGRFVVGSALPRIK